MKKPALVFLLVLVGACGTAREIPEGERYSAPIAAAARLFLTTASLDSAVPGVVSLDCRGYDVPIETADTLGPLAHAAGAGRFNPFVVVPVGRAALDRIEALAKEGAARLVWTIHTSGPAGEWITCRNELQGFSVTGIAVTPSGSLTIGREVRDSGIAGRVAVLLFPSTKEKFVAFRVHERMPLETPQLTCRAFGSFTRLPCDVPTIVERRAEDGVLVGEEDAVGLIGASPAPGMLRLTVLAPLRVR